MGGRTLVSMLFPAISQPSLPLRSGRERSMGSHSQCFQTQEQTQEAVSRRDARRIALASCPLPEW